MGWWGKVLGGAFGFMLGGPLGALLGAVLGHNLDKGLENLPENALPSPGNRERVQTAFFTATFSVMGHLAKADGRVSEDEIEMAGLVMDRMELDETMRRTAVRLFGEGKEADFPLDAVIEQFRKECRGRRTLIQMFIEIQLQAGYADGRLDPAEERLLLRICRLLHFPELLFRQLERMIQAEIHGVRGGTKASGMDPKDAYAILNIDPSASDAEVKKAYRRLTSQHHPDKLVAKGLPEEMMKLAQEKTHEIRQAYEALKKARGF